MKGSQKQKCALSAEERQRPHKGCLVSEDESLQRKKTSSNNKQKALRRTRTDTCKYAYLHRDIIGNAEAHRRDRGKKKRISTTREIEQEPLRDHRVNKNKKEKPNKQTKKKMNTRGGGVQG